MENKKAAKEVQEHWLIHYSREIQIMKNNPVVTNYQDLRSVS